MRGERIVDRGATTSTFLFECCRRRRGLVDLLQVLFCGATASDQENRCNQIDKEDHNGDRGNKVPRAARKEKYCVGKSDQSVNADRRPERPPFPPNLTDKDHGRYEEHSEEKSNARAEGTKRCGKALTPSDAVICERRVNGVPAIDGRNEKERQIKANGENREPDGS